MFLIVIFMKTIIQDKVIKDNIVAIILMSQNNDLAQHPEIEEGELPDDQESYHQPLPQPQSRPSPPPLTHPQQSSSSQDIIFQIVTQEVVSPEKKKKKIHKEAKDKKAIKQKQSKSDKVNKNFRSIHQTQQVFPSTIFQPHPAQMPIPQMNMQPQQRQIYPHPFMVPVNQQSSMSTGMFQMYSNSVQNKQYVPMAPNYTFRQSNPNSFPQQFMRNSYQGNQGYPSGMIPPQPVAQPNFNPQHIEPQLPRPQASSFRPQISNQPKQNQRNDIIEDNKGKIKIDKVDERQSFEKQGMKMNQQKAQKVNQNSRKKVFQDEIKLKVKKQLKILSPQIQLNLLEAIRCLIKYSDELNQSKQLMGINSRESYQRNIKYIESIVQESKDREQNVKKILQGIGLVWLWKDIQERKLYAWAMKDHNFKRIGLKYYPKPESHSFTFPVQRQ